VTTVPKFHLYAERSYCETSYGRCCWFHRSRFIVVGVIINACTGRSLCCSQIKSSSMSHCPMRAMPLPTSMIASSNWRTRHGAELVYGLEDPRRYGRLFCHLRATCRRQCLAKDDVTINLQDDVLTLEARVGRHSGRTLTGSVVRFSRVVQLPFRVDPEKVQARYNNRPSAAPEELKATTICPSSRSRASWICCGFRYASRVGKRLLPHVPPAPTAFRPPPQGSVIRPTITMVCRVR